MSFPNYVPQSGRETPSAPETQSDAETASTSQTHPAPGIPQESKPPDALRFVVLEHDSPRGRHWDLMLQQGDSLRTWALTQPPDNPGPILAEKLPDHRLTYLDYEGPVSGDRGIVHRWDRGVYHPMPLAESPTTHTEKYFLAGLRLRGMAILLLEQGAPGLWQFQFFPAPDISSSIDSDPSSIDQKP